MKAKLIREIPQREGLPYYFKMYEYECIECGAHYTRHQYSERINPYCGNCNLKHENQKQKERVARHEQKKINAVLDKIRAEIETNITILKEKTMQKMTKIMTEIPTEAFANIKEGYLCQEDTDDVIKSITQNATTLDAYLNNIRSEIEAELGTNDYKNEGIYAALHVMDKHIVECGKDDTQ